jgi:hypothetical protein
MAPKTGFVALYRALRLLVSVFARTRIWLTSVSSSVDMLAEGRLHRGRRKTDRTDDSASPVFAGFVEQCSLEAGLKRG